MQGAHDVGCERANGGGRESVIDRGDCDCSRECRQEKRVREGVGERVEGVCPRCHRTGVIEQQEDRGRGDAHDVTMDV